MARQQFPPPRFPGESADSFEEKWCRTVYLCYHHDFTELNAVRQLISKLSSLAFSQDDLLFSYAPPGRERDFRDALLRMLNETRYDYKAARDCIADVDSADCFTLFVRTPIDGRPGRLDCVINNLTGIVLEGASDGHTLMVARLVSDGKEVSFGKEDAGWSDTLIMRPSFMGVGIDLQKLFKLVGKAMK